MKIGDFALAQFIYFLYTHDMKKFEVGDRIFAPEYGNGSIVAIDDTHACIQFDDETSTRNWSLKTTMHYNEVTHLIDDIDTKGDSICIVCGEKAPNGSQCHPCWTMSKNFVDELDKNAKAYQLKNYYYNLSSSIWRMSNFESVKKNCNKLFAIANLTNSLHKDSSLSNKIDSDIAKIIEKKKPKEENDKPTKRTNREIEIDDSNNEKIIKTKDGHLVKSSLEQQIDDILFNARIVHSYDQEVWEITTDDDRPIFSDWYLPVVANKGIYIEYWGMSTSDYLRNKERKIKQYSEYNLPLIGIEKDELKSDTQGFEVRLIRQINKLAKEHYGVLNFVNR